jgi:hypothetical protein
MLGYGYDVFKSPYCSNQGHMKLLLDGLDEHSPSREIQLPEYPHSFRYPKIVQVSSDPKTDDYSIFAETIEEYTSQLSVKAGISVEFGAFSGSIDTSHSESTRTYLDSRFGEYGHIFSGFEIALPSTAAELRKLLNPDVKQDLLSKDPQELIKIYGTHLVRGLVIGAKARLLQSASRSAVKSKEEFAAAVTAEYGSLISASGSVDQQHSETIKEFQMRSEVHTLGGGDVIINSGAEFDAWLKLVREVPNVIDMTSVVPLYQLLDPVTDGPRRVELKKAILRYAKRFQIGALYGTNQQCGPSDVSLVEALLSGDESGRCNQIASGLGWSQPYKDSKSFLNVWQATGQEAKKPQPPQGMAIYGGRQRYGDSEVSSWGVNRHPQTGASLLEWVAFSGFAKHTLLGQDHHLTTSLWVGPIEDAPQDSFIAVGGKTTWDDGGEAGSWGLPATGNIIKNQPIAKIKGSTNGGYADGTLCLHLSSVQQTIPEVPEG